MAWLLPRVPNANHNGFLAIMDSLNFVEHSHAQYINYIFIITI